MNDKVKLAVCSAALAVCVGVALVEGRKHKVQQAKEAAAFETYQLEMTALLLAEHAVKERLLAGSYADIAEMTSDFKQELAFQKIAIRNQ